MLLKNNKYNTKLFKSDSIQKANKLIVYITRISTYNVCSTYFISCDKFYFKKMSYINHNFTILGVNQ